jgi:hypothetical protein
MKQMDMRYMSPSMPVNVTLQQEQIEEGSSLQKSKSKEVKNIGQEQITFDHDQGRDTAAKLPSFQALSNLFEPPPRKSSPTSKG